MDLSQFKPINPKGYRDYNIYGHILYLPGIMHSSADENSSLEELVDKLGPDNLVFELNPIGYPNSIQYINEWAISSKEDLVSIINSFLVKDQLNSL